VTFPFKFLSLSALVRFAELHAPHAIVTMECMFIISYIHVCYIVYVIVYLYVYVSNSIYRGLKTKKLRLSLGTIQRGDLFCLVNFCKFFDLKIMILIYIREFFFNETNGQQNPANWQKHRRMLNIFFVSYLTTLVPWPIRY
jgi:hypothetical protein